LSFLTLTEVLNLRKISARSTAQKLTRELFAERLVVLSDRLFPWRERFLV
jgi:hypothetical protein